MKKVATYVYHYVVDGSPKRKRKRRPEGKRRRQTTPKPEEVVRERSRLVEAGVVTPEPTSTPRSPSMAW